MMVFFGHESGDPPPPLLPLPPGMTLRIWQPARHGFPPHGSRDMANVVWWLLNRLGFFVTDEFTELTVWRGDTKVHRLLVTPRWHRSPFMGPDDLEVGNMWTRPDARGQKLGHTIIGEAYRLFGDRERRWWWLTDDNNAASIAIAARCNYRRIGAGYKTRPLGIRLWGQYRFDPSGE
jgi:GNAT superfamily N-acetyltransferase